MLDANACIRQRACSKAYARQAEVFTHLQQYHPAIEACMSILPLTVL